MDTAGNAVVNLPLSFSLAGVSFPFQHDVSSDGKTLSLTPVIDPADARLLAQPVASQQENQRAQDAFVTEFDEATGGPTVMGAGIDVIQTFLAPPGTTHWNQP